MAGTAERLRHRQWLRLPAVGFIGVYCALLLCVPSRLVVGPIGSPGTPANLWGILALVWWICAALAGQTPGGRSPVRMALGFLAISVLVSYAAAMANGWFAPSNLRAVTDDLYNLIPATVEEISTKMLSAADRGLLTFAGWCGIVLITCDGVRSWKDLELLIAVLGWVGSFVAAIGVIQFFTGADLAVYLRLPGLVANAELGGDIERSLLRRVASTAIHPIEFGVVMAGIFPLAIHRTIHHWRRVSAWVPTVLIGMVIPMTVSRTGILVTIVAFIIIIIGWPARWRIRALVIAPVVTVVMRLMIPGLVGTLVSLFGNLSNDPSVTGRTDDYSVVFALFLDHAWLGRGLFTFIPRYYRILDNQFFMILIELGILGLIAVVTFVLVGYFSARGARRRSTDPQQRNLALMLSGSIAGVYCSFLTNDAWGAPMAAGLSFLLVGIAGAAWRVSNGDRSTEQRTGEPAHELLQ